ncbi:2-dehydropantoate 2-reductase [Variovorax sp. PBS-H4]|uniref:ketopantoate reductase family protein n=1 Tax=Variovorax sp. PBS-H4 TaxID=434008 RepID=UPI0013195543|nr:2-dehydropantoate 2-reductase [Variovorax sp. PBS-H4]VTU34331.1 2-dehydropantoate 2-reductase [Variovorax sp. PBS-H4]
MKVCVFGAGAVGGHLAARLGASSSCELTIVARGPHLEAIKRSGITLESREGTWCARPAVATDDPSVLPVQDIVFVTLKSTMQSAVARAIRGLVGTGGHAVFVNNGVPWWWNDASRNLAPLPLIDHGVELWSALGPERAVGCVVYSGNEVLAPARVRHSGGNRWIVGEPDNSLSERVSRTVKLLKAAGLEAEVSCNLRQDVFAKLLLNASYNSVAALTGLPIEWFSADESVKRLVFEVIDELAAVARSMGYDVEAARVTTCKLRRLPDGFSIDQGQRPSMLQDVAAGRPTEVEALLGQVCLFGDEHRVPCPCSKTLLWLLRGVNQRLAASC